MEPKTEDKDVKLAEMVWSALWEEPERPGSKTLYWIIGGIAVMILVAYFILRK